MKRVLLPSGKFAPYKKSMELKSEKKVESKIEKGLNGEMSNDISELKFKLSGDETRAEIKAMLDQVGVEYAKNTKTEKMLDLLGPYVIKEDASAEL